MTKLVLQQIVKRYNGSVAVDGVSMEIAEGEFVSLLGPSGCGKTTTLRMIAGFMNPTSGRIVMNGRELSSPQASVPPERRDMSMIFQSYAIWPNMTVAQNVGFGLKLRKLAAGEIRRRTMEMLEVVQMAHLANRYPAELSGGQQQRVALARAVVVKPGVLLLDEPLSNLDANLREEMRIEIKRLHDEFKITTVYVTHDQSEAMATSDRIAVMNAGKIEQLDSPFEIYNRPTSAFVASFIGRTNFLNGEILMDRLAFEGFAFDRSPFAETLNGHMGPARFSVRPQTLKLHRGARPEGAALVEATVVERTYLGETWDYVVTPVGSSVQLHIAALPSEVHEAGDRVWLQFDPRQMIAIA